MIETYKTNATMRNTFYRINHITHAEAWDTEEGYQVALCSDDGVGFRESPEFFTVGQCAQWVKTYCPELRML